jgi:Phasin protein
MPDEVKAPQKPKAATGSKDWVANIEPLFATNRRAFECFARGMSKLSHDMAQFMQSRLLEDSMMWEKLATCRDAADAFECQNRFTAKVQSDYAEAAQKFSRLMLDIAGSFGASSQHSSPETD